MPQPHPDAPNESDPLLAFFEEHQGPPPEPVELSAKAEDPAADDLRRRLERAERHVERALIEISTLKSDQATLVSAVEDIRKRLSRPVETPARVVPVPARRAVRARTIATIFVLLALGAAAWGLFSATSYELPEPPRIERISSSNGQALCIASPNASRTSCGLLRMELQALARSVLST